MAIGPTHLGTGIAAMKNIVFSLVMGFVAQIVTCTLGLAAEVAPYGANLFQGNFAGMSKSAVVSPGDNIVLRIWGDGVTVDGVFAVSDAGNLDAPDVGSIPVSGLPAERVQEAVRSKLAASGHGNSQCYVSLRDAGEISVFVTGGVNRPGRYSGRTQDSILAFLDRAGGINPDHGSFRDVRLLRQGEMVRKVDIYPFIRHGSLPSLRFRDGDTLVVGQRGAVVSASGAITNTARFEFVGGTATGAALMDLVDPQNKVTHVSISGTRQGAPYNTYIPVGDFGTLKLADGDMVQFMADGASATIMVAVQGAVRGASRFPVRRGARLREVQDFIAVEPGRSNLAAIYVKRKSVALSQKKAISDSLRRLEQSVMVASSASNEEAQIRGKEAEMVAKFVERAKTVEPDGIVVLDNGQESGELVLEDGDCIVIPEKSDVVMVSGEVVMPKAMLWHKDKKLSEYIAGAGGFSARADRDKVLVMHPNGAVSQDPDKISAGDHVLVLPKPETKSMQTVKDISQVLMQVAVSTGSVLGLPFFTLTK